MSRQLPIMSLMGRKPNYLQQLDVGCPSFCLWSIQGIFRLVGGTCSCTPKYKTKCVLHEMSVTSVGQAHFLKLNKDPLEVLR
jgi:hypothetical protein